MNFGFWILDFRFWRAPLFVLALTASVFAQHEGHDHSHGGHTHDEKPAATAKTGAKKSALVSATAERNLQTADGQFVLKLTRTPSDPRTGENAQFVLSVAEKVEGGFGDEPLTIDKADVTASVLTAQNGKIAENIVAKNEGAGRFRVAHNFGAAGNYKIAFSVVTGDKRRFEVDFPVTVTSSPVNWGFWIGFAVLSLLTTGAVGLIFNRLSAANVTNKTRRAVPFVIAALLFFGFGTFALARFQTGDTRTIDENSALEAETPSEIASALTGRITVSKESQILFGIKTEEIEARRIGSGLKTNGIVRARPDARAVVAPPVAGKINFNSNLTLGSAVARGKRIGTVEQILDVSAQTELESQRLEVEAQSREIEARRIELRNTILNLETQKTGQRGDIAAAKTRLAQARREVQRAKNLIDVGAAPRKRLEEAETAVRIVEQEIVAAENQIKSIDAAIKTANAGQNSFRQPAAIRQPSRSFPIFAPITGIVSEINVTTGSQIESGADLMEIVNLSTVLLEANVFEGNLNTISESKGASFTAAALGGEVYRIDGGSEGDLLSIGQTVNAEARTVPVIYAVKNPLQKLREGMFVEITIDTSADARVLAVPKAAVVSENGENFVFVLTGGENFERRLVALGTEGAEFYEVTSGVAEHERVVVTGVYQLRTTKPNG